MLKVRFVTKKLIKKYGDIIFLTIFAYDLYER